MVLSLSRLISRPGGVVLLALAACPSKAQVPIAGTVACGRCTALAELPAATLFGFKLQGGDLDALPDVLYDETNAGGGRVGVPSAPTPTSPLWMLPPNWRIPQVSRDLVVAIVIDRGTLSFDAGTIANRDYLAILLQSTCSFGGRAAPLVRDIPGGHAVEWNPVLEENPTDLVGGGGCTLGAPAARSFVIGYNIYRLDVATFPAPTLREFLVDGYIGHADVRLLDFNVPDPDGGSGSDLDSTDNLILRNPDGLPDTGDEVLVYSDGAAGPGAAWYRLQPVVRGGPRSPGCFATGECSSQQADLLDLDGDGTLESVDILRDGFVEFIDPSGRGLGLTHGGEIASSFLPGLGVPPAGSMGCDSRPAAAGETDCDDGVDDDGDGGIDCMDDDCCGDAACLVPPPDIARLDVAKTAVASDDVIVSWVPAPPIRAGATYDVLSGCIARRPLPPGPPPPGCLWSDRSISAAACLANDSVTFSLLDSRPIDADVVGVYYLVREQVPCGVAGSYGTDSLGGLRVPGPADCGR